MCRVVQLGKYVKKFPRNFLRTSKYFSFLENFLPLLYIPEPCP